MQKIAHLKNIIQGENSYFGSKSRILPFFGEIIANLRKKIYVSSVKKIYILTISREKPQILSLIMFNI